MDVIVDQGASNSHELAALAIDGGPAAFGDDLAISTGQHAFRAVAEPLGEPAGSYFLVKRLVDLMCCIPAIILLAIILVPIALLIFLEDGWPPLYRGEAIGLDGKRFQVLKIRTMRRDADAYLDKHLELRAAFLENYKLPEDPRVLRIGRFLRRSSLDELPQAINVLMGQMTWVGPRYVRPDELERYGAFSPLRLRMLPGITGLWQVSGRSNLPYPLRVIYDRTYYFQRSTRMDLWILVATIPAVLRRRGAI
jgi:exopolysaccharide production protein ExoY